MSPPQVIPFDCSVRVPPSANLGVCLRVPDSTSSRTEASSSSLWCIVPCPPVDKTITASAAGCYDVFSPHAARKAAYGRRLQRSGFLRSAHGGRPDIVSFVTESKGRDIGRLLLSLLAVATAAAIQEYK